MRKIFVVGSINRDLVVYVDGLPRPGETVFGNRFQQFPGGKGANQAVAASRLGGDVHLVGNVGADAFGKEMLDFLAGENIDTSEIAILDTAPTGIALITVDSASENCIVVVSGANMVWHTADLARMKIERGDIVVCQFEIPLEIIESVFERAKEIGATTILNPAPIAAATERILKNVDYLVVNEVELEAFSNTTVNPGDPTSVYIAMEKLHPAWAARNSRHLRSPRCSSRRPDWKIRSQGPQGKCCRHDWSRRLFYRWLRGSPRKIGLCSRRNQLRK